ncbi:aminoglycoside phosphotransferase family protein [Streptomyces sp. TRM68367]|uniref:phosphotransferase family protein n=1 Tax=Streptomyces sp. TRM68367 TaxID=2758415 RepID=UPI002934E3C9|nr:aminoglycoside phosphotransferase family protein [Streptomyces sp. TRM68367]
MGAPPLPRPFRGERATPDDELRAFVARARRLESAGSGHHNHNHVLDVTEPVAERLGRGPGTRVIVRIPRPDALPVVIRTWRNETHILRALKGTLPHAPECLCAGDGFAIHSYVDGVPLSRLTGNGKPVDTLHVRELAALLARTTRVRRRTLPPLPAFWPRDTDSQGFLRTLAHLADRQIRQPNWPVFGGLFAALGVPEDALPRLAERVPAMSRRPYSLLHTDLHRDNVIVTDDPGTPLVCVDWELATYGDPLHDLATHLVRMRYPDHQRAEVVEEWARAMREVRPAAVAGLARDLDHYLAFERAQSVYPDVMRAAHDVRRAFGANGTEGEGLDDAERRLDAAALRVQEALEAAAEPLRLGNVPSRSEISGALFRWLLSRGEGEERGRIARAFPWQPDRRVPEHPELPAWAVQAALAEEGAAPASRVFKGTGHLNTVVRVPGVGFPVVVRRKLPDDCRREGGFLSEHSVLRAIAEAPVAVAAPRVLALGTSYPGDPFAIHTYEVPGDPGRLPGHPVHGLLPHEADGLVDQLCALTRVKYEQVDPAAGEGRFHRWLCGHLVALVEQLPEDSKQAARHLGLPDADRLHEMLARHRVSERRPALLHGDLNPWNLVRRADSLALTIIDWELAVVGDPLYELVRHMHLTPTRPEIRDRMFRRWESGLPDEYTRDWRRDWRVYRWLEIVRSAYVDLDRLVTGAGLDAPNVRRAVESYAMTLAAAKGTLGLPVRPGETPGLGRAPA